MTKLSLIAAVASAIWALPASAADEGNAPSKPEVTLAQLNFCVGPDCGYRDERYYDRYYNDWRYRRDNDWRYQYGARGCRDVTIRERRPDGDVVVRRERRCD
jgi:hypothetical protein